MILGEFKLTDRFNVKFLSAYEGKWKTQIMDASWEPAEFMRKAGAPNNVFEFVNNIASHHAYVVNQTPFIYVNDIVVWDKKKGYSEEWEKLRMIFELQRK